MMESKYFAILLLILSGEFFRGVVGASSWLRHPISWSETDHQFRPSKNSKFLLGSWDLQLHSVKSGFLDHLTENVNNTGKGLWNPSSRQEYLNLKEQQLNKQSTKAKKTNGRHQHFRNLNYLPIELESFVGDTLEKKLTSFSAEKSPFLDWLREIERESRQVEKLMMAEKRSHSGLDHHHHLRTCDTEYGWRNLGKDHYPQFIRTATCTASNCFSDLYRCVPRQYTLKVLKKLEPDEIVDPAAAVKLPEALRSSVKFINVTTNICCECALS